MITLYYYESIISPNLDYIERHIAKYCNYIGEEGLMKIIERDIYTIDCLEDLEQYEVEYGYEKGELSYLLETSELEELK